MSHRGLALMGVGYSQGTNAAYDAAKAAIESPLLDNVSIDGAMGVLVHFDIHPDYPILEISAAMDIVEENADEDANVIFGTTTNTDMTIDEVKITIIATGFEKMNSKTEPIIEQQSIPQAQKQQSQQPIRRTTSRYAGGAAGLSKTVTRKIVGGDLGSNEDLLDVPTFLRRQMD